MKIRKTNILKIPGGLLNYQKVTKQYCNDSRCARVRKGEKHLAHNLTDVESSRRNSLEELISAGTHLAGTGIGTAIGLIMGGPDGVTTGSMIGVGIGHVLNSAGSEISKRFLSPREKNRLGAVLIYTSNKIDTNIKNGLQIRNDDFFSRNLNERSSADEIAEGVLQVAQRDHEEKKLPYYGNLLANIAFYSEINRGNANLLVKIAGRLSYSQLCLLSIFGKNKFRLRGDSYRSNLRLPMDLIAILQEVYELGNYQLIGQEEALLSMADIVPGKLKLAGQGTYFFQLMELSKMPSDELDLLVEKLSH